MIKPADKSAGGLRLVGFLEIGSGQRNALLNARQHDAHSVLLRGRFCYHENIIRKPFGLRDYRQSILSYGHCVTTPLVGICRFINLRI